MKHMKYLAFIPTGPNTWGHQWMRGPVSFDEWLPCFRVFANAMEMLGYSRATPLLGYQSFIQRLVNLYPHH